RESGGSYTAQNGQYYGRYQLMLAYLNGDLSPENQERVADAYVIGRYGSWLGALAHSNAKGWY
ncbi:aggregation-promoting factor C-terminal-like domain-containing protein, partial [Streptococcus pyogenes]